MEVLNVLNVHEALPEGIRLLYTSGIQRESRNGPVLVMPCPVATVYQKPKECVLFWEERDANPFFHFFEPIWMLLGRDDVGSITRVLPSMAKFSDDGKVFHGAYGKRWRSFFGKDQLAHIAGQLHANHEERRAVLTMWSPEHDLGGMGKDLPCNTHAYFWIIDGYLHMTVCNRSNDIIWGAYGANAVHFSFLLQFMAAWIGVQVGTYTQMSNNFHGYLDTLSPLAHLQNEVQDKMYDPYQNRYTMPNPRKDPYAAFSMVPYPLVGTTCATWLADAEMFWDEWDSNPVGFKEPFFRKVAIPMKQAFRAYKEGKGDARYIDALAILTECLADDWRTACTDWINRRYEKFKAKQAAQQE